MSYRGAQRVSNEQESLGTEEFSAEALRHFVDRAMSVVLGKIQRTEDPTTLKGKWKKRDSAGHRAVSLCRMHSKTQPH